MQEDIIDWQDLVPSDYHFFGPTKEALRGEHYVSDEKVKTVEIEWLKKQSTGFYEVGIHILSFERGTLLLRETATMLKSWDVIPRGSASSWCMIRIPVSVIIPVLKKKVLLFDSPLK